MKTSSAQGQASSSNNTNYSLNLIVPDNTNFRKNPDYFLFSTRRENYKSDNILNQLTILDLNTDKIKNFDFSKFEEVNPNQDNIAFNNIPNLNDNNNKYGFFNTPVIINTNPNQNPNYANTHNKKPLQDDTISEKNIENLNASDSKEQDDTSKKKSKYFFLKLSIVS